MRGGRNIRGMCHHLLYVRQGTACPGQGGRDGTALRYCVEAYGGGAPVRHCLHHPVLHRWYGLQRSAGCACRAYDRRIPDGGVRETDGGGCPAGGGAAGGHSLGHLRTGWHDGPESGHVQAGEAGLCRQQHPSVYRRRQRTQRRHCPGDHDPAYGDQHQ